MMPRRYFCVVRLSLLFTYHSLIAQQAASFKKRINAKEKAKP
jgi:hypothetical protein